MTSDLRPQDLESNVRSLSRIVGGGYKGFWNSKDLYVVCKGSKGSKKSKTQALKIVYNMMKPCYELANTLVVRKIGKTIRNTCFTEVRWAIEALGVRELWKVNSSEMKIEYLPTGQVILFAGMDDPLKLASLTVLRGHLCWVWFEEASDFSNYDDVLKLMMSIRGQLPPGYYKQFTFTFNPWSEHHWLKKEFFDKERDDAYVCTTTFRDNEFLGADDIKRYYDLYKNSPRMARIICDGEWGVAEGLIYDNWIEEDFDLGEVMAKHPDAKPSFGLDFGYSISFNAFVAILVDLKDREMWIYDEYYANGQSNIDLAKAITEMGYAKEEIWADAAEPKSIDEMSKGFDEVTYDENNQPIINHYQLPRIRPALKGADSVQNGIQRMQSFRIHVHPRCINTLIEFNNYAWDTDKDGNFIDKPIKEWDHCLVAGTMVTTDHGEMPIEDIQVGDMVLTHLGYRRVTASGITRPEPAEIWRVTFEDGSILEGTADHPIITIDGLKYMFTLTEGVEVVQWEDPQANAGKQSVSNMMDTIGTDIQIVKEESRECITGTLTIPMESYCFTDISGPNIMDQSLKDTRSITSMRTLSTTTSPTLHVSQSKTMSINTHGQKRNVRKEETPCVETHGSKTNAENGMPQKKGMHGMSNMERELQKICNQSSLPVNIVERISCLCQMGSIDSALILANQQLEERRGSTTLSLFVQSVVKHSLETNTQNQNVVVEPVQPNLESVVANSKLLRVVSVEKTTRSEFVYDLTVDEAHTFFANSIFVANCLDAARYALSKFYIRGKGHVVEVKGLELLEAPSGPAVDKPRKSRRVITVGAK